MVGRVLRDPPAHCRVEGLVMATFVLRLFRDEQGQDLIEYALLTAVIGFAGLAVFGVLLDVISNTYRYPGSGREQPAGSPRIRQEAARDRADVGVGRHRARGLRHRSA